MTRPLVFAFTVLAVFTQGCGGGSSSEPPKGPPPITYSVGGTVSGLESGPLVLSLNDDESLTRSEDGAFTFTTALSDNEGYSVTIETMPADHDCTVTAGEGSITAADVDDVLVECELIPETTVSGVAQKGPFRIGSDVRVYELDEDLVRTGVVHAGLTTTARGGFEVAGEIRGRFVEIEVDGQYFDEWRNVMTTDSVTLRTIARFEPGTELVTSVNVLSELTLPRIRNLVNDDGLDFDDAVVQARREAFEAYALPYVDEDLLLEPDFLAGEGTQAFIIALMVMGQLTEDVLLERLQPIANDLADNGTIDDTDLRDDLRNAVRNLEADKIATRLHAFGLAAGDENVSMPDILGPLAEHDVWLTVEGLLGPGLSVKIDGYPPVEIDEDGRWLIASVPEGTSRDLTVVSWPDDPIQYCGLLVGMYLNAIRSDKELETNCFIPTADFYVVVEGLPEGPIVGLRVGFEGITAALITADGRYPMTPFLLDAGTPYNVVIQDSAGLDPDACVVIDGQGTVTLEQALSGEVEVLVQCEA